MHTQTDKQAVYGIVGRVQAPKVKWEFLLEVLRENGWKVLELEPGCLCLR